MNIFDYAMQMEIDGKNFYQKLSESTATEGLRTIFLAMADDELKHYELFKQLKAKTGKQLMVDSQVLDNAKNIFTEMQRQGIAPKDGSSNLEAYRFAMQTEADSALLYHQAAEKEIDQQVKELLLRIANEERKHYHIIENIFEFVNAPNVSLVWGEFSNLEEF